MAKLRGANRSKTASMARSSKCTQPFPRETTGGIQKRCVFGMGSPSRTESHAQPLLTVGDHSNMAPRSSSGADGYPIRKTCDLRIFPIEMILNKYFLEETPGNESKRTIPTDTGNPHSYASPLPATVMGAAGEREMKNLYSRKRKEMHRNCYGVCVCAVHSDYIILLAVPVVAYLFPEWLSCLLIPSRPFG